MSCLNMASHVVVVTFILFQIGGFEVYIGLSVIAVLMYKISKPYLTADNQLHKVGATLWGPIHSYFHETQRGTTIIRAFG